MKQPQPESTNPDLSFETRTDWLAGYLRADQIRTDTLVSLVAGWSDPDTRDDVIEALDYLFVVTQSARQEGALDAAVEAVEDAASMDTARIEIDGRTARRLFAELATVTKRLSRFNPQALAPWQRDRKAS
jgi:hypothetical protein